MIPQNIEWTDDDEAAADAAQRELMAERTAARTARRRPKIAPKLDDVPQPTRRRAKKSAASA